MQRCKKLDNTIKIRLKCLIKVKKVIVSSGNLGATLYSRAERCKER